MGKFRDTAVMAKSVQVTVELAKSRSHRGERVLEVEGSMRRCSIRLLALLVAVLVAVPAHALARTRYLCHMSGLIGDKCRCSHAAPSQAKVVEKTLTRQDCCERVGSQEPGVAPAAIRQAGRDGAPLALAAVFTWSVSALSASNTMVRPPLLARAPPRGPPLFLSNCALLL